MAIGYACLIYGNPKFKLKSCTLKTADSDKLFNLIDENLDTLSRMIDYNISNKIRLFRISSDIVPFASHPVNTLDWTELFEEKLSSLGEKIRRHKIRVSMHPGQYTVLNSPRSDVVQNAVLDLEYHCKFLDSLNLDCSHKIVLHIGGVYGDKGSAIDRFKTSYSTLSQNIKSRLIIENDEKSYSISDVMSIGRSLCIPVVFDNLHHSINSPDSSKSEAEWISEAQSTWSISDGNQKIHYSQQKRDGKLGSHSKSIDIDAFLDFYSLLQNPKPDIMLEVKDKNISAIKCINCVSKRDLGLLQREWARYKYLTLYHSHSSYLHIRSMFGSEDDVSAISFYRKVEESLSQTPSVGSMTNAFSHIWGYFKDVCTEKELSSFKSSLLSFESGEITPLKFKRFLYRLSEKYGIDYLLDSYFFSDIF